MEVVRTISLLEQTVSVISGLVLKPSYMLLTLLLLLWMRKTPGRDFQLIRRGLLLFLIGESFCAADFLLTGGAGYKLDILHSLGMAAMGALTAQGLVEFFDVRILRFTVPKERCAAKRYCEECAKEHAVRCILKDMFAFLTVVFAVAAALPLTLPLRARFEIARVFQSEVVFSYPPEGQLLDFRILPATAIGLFLIAFFLLVSAGHKGIARAKTPFFWGVGFMSFSLFRFFLNEAFRTAPVWADFWEEITEFAAVVGIGLFFYWVRKKIVPDTGGQ